MNREEGIKKEKEMTDVNKEGREGKQEEKKRKERYQPER